MSERRRARLRLESTWEAARLFWAQGVAGTSGDQIAETVGLSTRTVWRHFRSKESCAEPIVLPGVLALMSALRGWPRHSSLEDHLAAELAGQGCGVPDAGLVDEMLAMKMIRLTETEPALRTAWLMACDRTAREMCVLIGERLGRPAGDLEVRVHAAAAAAVVRMYAVAAASVVRGWTSATVPPPSPASTSRGPPHRPTLPGSPGNSSRKTRPGTGVVPAAARGGAARRVNARVCAVG